MSGDLDAFRAEARAWLEANFPASLKGRSAPGQAASTVETGDAGLWKQRMADKGWGAPTWPVAYSGGGLNAREARVVQEEMARVGAYNPCYVSLGLTMVGPTVLDYGTEEQKQQHLPAIARGEKIWCLGYSEPGAGSDLASLQTKCEDKGDHWLINGSKIWTSGGQYADWCFCLTRTDTTRKHEGITFILVPMHNNGVEVRPIKLIAGSSPFCETFFTDAKASKEDTVGPVNGGWTVAKRLLQHERSGMGGARGAAEDRPKPGEKKPEHPVIEAAKKYIGTDAKGRIADLDIRNRLIDWQMSERALRVTNLRNMAEARSNTGPSAATSIMKNASMKVSQDRAELMLEIMGHQGLGWEGEGFSPQELSAVRGWLSGKAGSIFGGSNEIQSNIISKRILGLPDATRSV